MPRGKDVAEAAGLAAPAGCYERLRQHVQRRHDEPDPRLVFGTGPDELARLVVAAISSPASPLLAALTAGKPVTVPTWMALPGNTYPGFRETVPWLADRSVTHVRITADDRILPGDPADQLARR
jgi:hypothetical protein